VCIYQIGAKPGGERMLRNDGEMKINAEEAKKTGRRTAARILYEYRRTGRLGALRLALPAILAYYSLQVGDEELEGWFDTLTGEVVHYRDLARERGEVEGLPDGEKLALVRRFLGEVNEPEYR